MAETHHGAHGAHASHGAHAAHGAAPHKHGEMDITEQKRMFGAFIRFWVLVFGASAGVLIFLAIFNS